MISEYARLKAKSLLPFLSPEVAVRCDSIAFARSFELIERELERVEFTPTKSELLIPSGNFGASKGHKTVTYRVIEDMGQAEFIGHGVHDLPRVDLDAREHSIDIETIGVEYAWSIQELNAVALDPSIPIESERKRIAIDTARRKHDEIAALGSAKFNRKGFLNSDLVPLVSPITGTWSSASADNILNDVLKLFNAVRVNTADNYRADTLLVDDTSWTHFSKPRANTDLTIREWLLKNVDGLKTIEPWTRLNLANVAGNGPRAVAYKKDPAVVRYYNVLTLEELPPQHKKLDIVVPCYGLTGFTNIRRPKGIAYMDGI